MNMKRYLPGNTYNLICRGTVALHITYHIAAVTPKDHSVPAFKLVAAEALGESSSQ